MNAINNIEEINDLFYADREQRKNYIQSARDVFDKVKTQLNVEPDRILALNRSWFSEMLIAQGKDVLVLPSALNPDDRFDMVLATDEMLTRTDSEIEQKNIIQQLVSLLAPGGVLLVSLRDFKNTYCHRRMIGDSCFAQINRDRYVITEVNEPSSQDKQKWSAKYHVVVNDQDFSCLEVGSRRTLYFKQLAKYCSDSGVTDFGNIKDGYWRNHLRRMPEHLIYARTK